MFDQEDDDQKTIMSILFLDGPKREHDLAGV